MNRLRVADNAFTATAKYSEVSCGRPERDRSDEVAITAIVGCALATVSVILRIIARWTGAGGEWGIDDFIIVPTMFVSIFVQVSGSTEHMLMHLSFLCFPTPSALSYVSETLIPVLH